MAARVIEALQAGQAGADGAAAGRRARRDALLQPLTAKPVLFVANVDEGSHEVPAAIAEHARAQGAAAVAVSARLEAELAELDARGRRRDARRPRAHESGLERSCGAPSRCSS